MALAGSHVALRTDLHAALAERDAERKLREVAEREREVDREEVRIAIAAQEQAEERARKFGQYVARYAIGGIAEHSALRAEADSCLAALASQPADERRPSWCDVHQSYSWCEHNGGVMGRTGYEQPADERGEEKSK